MRTRTTDIIEFIIRLIVMTDLEVWIDIEVVATVHRMIIIGQTLEIDFQIVHRVHIKFYPDLTFIAGEDIKIDLCSDRHTETTLTIDTIQDQNKLSIDLMTIFTFSPADS